MGLKIVAEIELPLTKEEAETVMALSYFNVSVANGAIADLEPEAPDKVCGALDPGIDPQRAVAICTYKSDHKGRHRFQNFGQAQEE